VKKYSLLIFFLFSLNISYAQWVQTKGPTGGFITTLAANEEFIFAGAGSSLIFRSSNSGGNWEPVNKGFENVINVNNIAISGSNIYAGTDNGIYLSTNNGDEWKNVLNIGHINDVKINDKKIYVATFSGIYLSINNGLDWKKISLDSNGYHQDGAKSIAFIDDVVFACNTGNIAPNGTWHGEGIYSTTNDGEKWDYLSNDLSDRSVKCLATKGDSIYAGLEKGKIIFSSDNGVMWKTLSKGLADSINCITFKDNIIFAGTMYRGIFRSNNNGDKWDSVSTGLTNKSIRSFAIKNENFFAGTLSGVSLSTDNGINWFEANTGLVATTVLDLKISNGSVITGTYQCGVSKSIDNGNSWKATNLNFANNSIYKLAINNNNIFAALYFGNEVYLSQDNGENWKAVSQIPKKKTQFLIYNISIFNDIIFASTSEGLFKSVNNGTNWTELDTNLIVTKTYIECFTSIDTIIYAGTNNGLYISSNKGNNWTLQDSTIKNITCFEVNGNNIYAGTYENGVLLSTDNGLNWTEINKGNPNKYIKSLTSIGSNFFAGTYDGGIYLSTNNGLNWSSINTGLSNLNITSLEIYNEIIYASCFNSGVYKAKLSDFGITGVEEKTETEPYFYSYPPYPLPAINEVQSLIYWESDFEINTDESMIYNIYGEKIDSKGKISLNKLTPYSGHLIWDCSNVEPGIYIIRVKHGTGFNTIKVMVSK
jgi:photosystem II stability/assembly factor-like uncharacterized protein